jgi:hypothetical protein
MNSSKSTPRKLKIDFSRSPDDIPTFATTIGEQGWLILQTYPKLVFRPWRPGDPIPELGSEFAGRLFGPSAETRWFRDPTGFHLWRYQESADGTEYDAIERYYYGLGEWQRGRFWEPILPQPLDYPILHGVSPAEGDRPRFHIVEYLHRPPTVWPKDPDQLENLLNQPYLAAYRIYHFDVGSDDVPDHGNGGKESGNAPQN